MQPILVAGLFAPLNDELLRLLRGLQPDDWNARAVGTWTVKDVASHLLDSSLRRLSAQRDRHVAPFPGANGLANIINEMNAQWVSATRRISPQILIEMLDEYGQQMAKHMTTYDPYADAEWPVSWAGDGSSPNWFDTARELTERWHHQQQIRDATKRPPLYELRFFKPVMDTFMRGLPYAYRNVTAAEGTTVTLDVRDVTRCSLTRVRDSWAMDEDAGAGTSISMTGDTAWRLFTKGLARDEARRRSEVTGDVTLAEPLFSMVAVIA